MLSPCWLGGVDAEQKLQQHHHKSNSTTHACHRVLRTCSKGVVNTCSFSYLAMTGHLLIDSTSDLTVCNDYYLQYSLFKPMNPFMVMPSCVSARMHGRMNSVLH